MSAFVRTGGGFIHDVSGAGRVSPGFPLPGTGCRSAGHHHLFVWGMALSSRNLGELRTRQPGMMTLVAVAITAAYAYSVAVAVGWLEEWTFLGTGYPD